MKIENLIYEIKQKIAELETEIKNEKNTQNEQKKYLKRAKNKIFRSIDYWISHGMMTREAIELVASDLDKNPDDLAFLYARYNREKKALKKYAQRFMIQKLLDNNFKTKQIAEILKMTPQMVYLIKKEKKPDFDPPRPQRGNNLGK